MMNSHRDSLGIETELKPMTFCNLTISPISEKDALHALVDVSVGQWKFLCVFARSIYDISANSAILAEFISCFC